MDVFSASAQVGGQQEAQAALARVGISGQHGSATLDSFTIRGNAGTRNDDGSIGVNAGLSATAIGVEGTVAVGDGSVTFGAAISAGTSMSAGIRDADNDGKLEFCLKLSVGPGTAGFCIED